MFSRAHAKAVRHHFRGARVFKTSAFKLTALYFCLFVFFSLAGFYSFYWQARSVLEDQIVEDISREERELRREYSRGRINALAEAIYWRSISTSDTFYLLSTLNGDLLHSDIAEVPLEVYSEAGLYEGYLFRESDALVWIDEKWPDHFGHSGDNADGQRSRPYLVLARTVILPAGLRLTIARESNEIIRFEVAARRARNFAILLTLLAGLLAGTYSSWRALRRIERISRAMDRIAAGDISIRLPVQGNSDEVTRIAERVNRMLEQIERLMRGMGEVSENIAHELKTPLTRIRNRAEEALSKASSPEETKALLEGLLSDSDDLIRLFDALLHITRMEAGNTRLDSDVHEIKPMLQAIKELFEPLTDEAKMKIVVEAPEGLGVFVNRDLINQALSNLIDNAIKHAGAGIIALGAEKEGDRVRLYVRDEGAGIPAEDHERVLERFVRLTPSRSSPGSGLGLATVAAIARFHGDTIRMENLTPGLKISFSLATGAACA